MADTVIRLNQPAFTGVPLYLKIENAAGLIWNGSALVAYVLANLGTYAKSMTESPAGSGRYFFDFLALALPADDYVWSICRCMAGLPVASNAAISDPEYGSGSARWSGATFGTVALDHTQPVPASNTAQTVGDALNAARAQGFGKWVLVGTQLQLYAGDGTTIVKTLTLDSATAPTQRT